MSLSFEMLVNVGGILLTIGVAWGLMKGKMDKLSEKLETTYTESLRIAADANRSALRSHSRLDDHSGRLTKIEAGCSFHERRLDESLGYMRSEISGLCVTLDKHVDAMTKRLDSLADKIDALREER
jgi:hypothetical protein